MPYKSDAQRRYFHAAEDRGDISSKTVHEFDEASKGKKLPEKVKKKARGGEVEKVGLGHARMHQRMLESAKKLWRGGGTGEC